MTIIKQEKTLFFFKNLQNIICNTFSKIDGKSLFKEDMWNTKKGYGRTRILKKGKVFEQVSVNFSHVFGKSLPKSSSNKKRDLENCSYQASGISVVSHPKNPYVPTSHLNIRFFLAKNKKRKTIWWFGGGFDLTPYYGFYQDVIHWHTIAKKICQPFGDDIYFKYKKWCDDYFFIKHRNESRGIGGLFFDDLCLPDFHSAFLFSKSIGKGYIDAYFPIVNLRKSYSWGSRERNFQLYRRGRYVEFNLLLDRGTLFGIQSNGRIESILSSMPPLVKWEYGWHPKPNSPESKLYTDFLPIKDWIDK
ncbi:hemF [Wigglesworthia glossinidia endosymbiont of Glossina brevipalpis]|uniref:Oxygen-dependent coproporphyrinogen-III oxidase n=1 Tax=Wigglesworthia glossinidia brevipalpis TaxID=36870 RepID=HEM6_WIGBR|nr:RecName: Full=Oxygen-dependent coproporphyrinogen-III oxidase; Short=CPO; Short=Coprogen oxidase; Short=Coproporphyrinogenase [Wigglesworthia glossinidia endosymbiont of Glossina brevipalpis]BAC24730.1 hemF [Wigglesworthia glossinidia endosymbiont of Glossina brevipalpis]